ncbi:hypothetical protein ACLMAJ_05595 [Nocardia sp. KC 131]|uniref:hypothetical protein n=1 Tax=Nocardia arseniciresistens TaxID=3392119 RepID=UPI00398F2900
MDSITCRTCGNRVQVVKFSPAHTSVQWNAATAKNCAELADNGGGPVRGCAALRAGIESAVTAGVVGLSTRDRDLL